MRCSTRMLLACALAAGCGQTGLVPPDLAMLPDLAERPDLVPPYPAGPYGNHPGDTLPDFTLAGFRLAPGMTDSTLLPWATDIQVSEYARRPECKCLAVVVDAEWCGACRQFQPLLVSEVDGDPSFCVLEILQEGPKSPQEPSRSDVENWSQAFRQNFYVTQGTPESRHLFDNYGQIGLSFTLIVRPGTMQVLDAGKVLGSSSAAIQGVDLQIHADAVAVCAGG